MIEITKQLEDIATLARAWVSKQFPDWKLSDYDLKRFEPSFDLSRDESVLFLSGNIEMSMLPYPQLEKIVKQVDDVGGHVSQRISNFFSPDNIDIDILIRLVYHEPSGSILTNDEACKVAPKAFEGFC